MSREQFFLSNLAVIERVIAWVCARHGLRGADAEDFASSVKIRLVDHDYEVLAKFEGRSSLKTYLVAVATRLYLDFQAQRFGKWRPSAQARRLGPVALRLECLMVRDGLGFDEACGILLTDPGVTESSESLYAISLALPHRDPRGGGAPRPAESVVPEAERAERQELAERTFSALRRSLAKLPPRDLLFLRLHFERGFTVAEAARTLGQPQRALYRMKDDVLRGLRSDLDAAGIGSEDARELLASLDWEVALGFEEVPPAPAAEDGVARPSQGQEPDPRWDGEV